MNSNANINIWKKFCLIKRSNSRWAVIVPRKPFQISRLRFTAIHYIFSGRLRTNQQSLLSFFSLQLSISSKHLSNHAIEFIRFALRLRTSISFACELFISSVSRWGYDDDDRHEQFLEQFLSICIQHFACVNGTAGQLCVSVCSMFISLLRKYISPDLAKYVNKSVFKRVRLECLTQRDRIVQTELSGFFFFRWPS